VYNPVKIHKRLKAYKNTKNQDGCPLAGKIASVQEENFLANPQKQEKHSKNTV
jgi:hypothetical protein